MIEFAMQIISLLDPILIFWAIVLNILGYHLKRIGLPKCAPPLPLLLYMVAFVPCFGLGWIGADGFSGKAALYAVLYAISNAGLITLPAIFGYDIVHGFRKNDKQKLSYRFDFNPKCDWRLTTIVYATSVVAGMVAAGLIAGLALHETPAYSVCWAILFGGVALVIARIVLHEVKKVADAEDYAIDVYMLLSLGGWLGLILTNTWLGVSLYSALMVGAGLMALGVRFLDPVEVGEKEVRVTKHERKEKHKYGESDLEFLKRTLRFRFVDDNMDNASDPDKPLCEVDNEPLTCDEADARGFGALAAEGVEYCKMILAKKEEER